MLVAQIGYSVTGFTVGTGYKVAIYLRGKTTLYEDLFYNLQKLSPEG